MHERDVFLVESQTMTETREAFDAAAKHYDEHFNALPSAQRIRRIVWDVYLRYFKPGMNLLELNCGTGEDAIMLAQHGIHVHATDISKGMLEATDRKIAEHHLEPFVTTGILPFTDLGRLGGYVFDGVYSNFGGLNCLDDLRPVAAEFEELVAPGGYCILCLMSDFSFWETASFLLRGEFRRAFRRRPDGVLVNVQGHRVLTHYFSPRDIKEAFRLRFAPIEVRGLNILTPPPSSQRAYKTLGAANRFLERLDNAFSDHYPFSRVGDHFVIVLKHTH